MPPLKDILLRPAGPGFLVGLFLLALALRLINLLTLTGDDAFFRVEDSGEYVKGASAWIANGSIPGYLAGEIVLPTERMPVYFWFLVAIRNLFGEPLAAVAAVQSVIDAGTCVLIAMLGARLRTEMARLSGLVAALWPNLIIHANLVIQDTLFLFLLTAWLLALCHFAARPSLRQAGIVGLLFGAAFMVRSVLQFMVPLVPIVLILLVWRRSRVTVDRADGGGRGLALALSSPLVFLVAAALVLSPVLYRNITAFGTVSPTTQSGLHALFWTATLVRMDETGRDFKTEAQRTHARFNARMARRGIDVSKLNPFERDALYREMAVEELTSFPVWRLAKVWTQGAVINLFSPSILSDQRVRSLPRPSFYQTGGRSLPERAWRYFFDDPGWFQIIIALALIGVLVISIIKLIGLWQWLRHRPWSGIGMMLFVFYFLAISGPTAGPKYRMPFEPLMILLMALGLATLLGLRLWQRKGRGAEDTPAM